jgi:osmotically inducible lipoprotein OsmB
MKHTVKFTAAVLLAGSLVGCASMTPGEKGAAIGAAVGGVAGSALTGGSTAGTVGGAAAGALIGHEVRKNK